MKQHTVRQKLFLSNALMVIITLIVFLIINLVIIKIYGESIESEFLSSFENLTNSATVDAFLEKWTIQRNEFFLLLSADGILCILSFIFISQLFTKKLTESIMKPLDALAKAAQRIQANNLSQPIIYSGEYEFENVCASFNDMQTSILRAREQNQKYEKARIDMISGISHDLRTPLTAIKGTIKGLLDGVTTTPQQQKAFLRIAYNRTEEMDTLINQLLYVSRMESGNLSVSMQNIEVTSFLHHYVDLREKTLEPEKEAIQIKEMDTNLCLFADPALLTRILDNLLENSRKYAETNHLQITIESIQECEKTILCFHDNGSGVSEDKLAYLFDEFYRGDESRNKKDGNGLGLYIVKRLMELMNGSVQAKTKKGLSIFLEFPRNQKGENTHEQQ